jgi:hypothetical protein
MARQDLKRQGLDPRIGQSFAMRNPMCHCAEDRGLILQERLMEYSTAPGDELQAELELRTKHQKKLQTLLSRTGIPC